MSIRILKGDCRDVLATLPDESVHCVVTSPPYWGLRDYGTAKWEGGDPGCDHQGKPYAYIASINKNVHGGKDTKTEQNREFFRDVCGKCGARRIDSQIGLEPSFHDYIETMTGVFREVRRVLRRDGTLWLNMGDSYAASQYGSGGGWAKEPAIDGIKCNNRSLMAPVKLNHGLKPKDLCGIPWRLAFALQADGWYLRSDIIWSKPNPMPESVTDRPTKAHEYLFLLTKSERYYYDIEAIKEPATNRDPGNIHHKGCEAARNGDPFHRTKAGLLDYGPVEFRNRRTVWEIATLPFPEAHFATFPPALVEPCILAGCPQKCCAKCGAPWVREVEKIKEPRGDSFGKKEVGKFDHGQAGTPYMQTVKSSTVGWMPSCNCLEWACVKGCTVLDLNHGQKGRTLGGGANGSSLALAGQSSERAGRERESGTSLCSRPKMERQNEPTFGQSVNGDQSGSNREGRQSGIFDSLPPMRRNVSGATPDQQMVLTSVSGAVGCSKQAHDEGLDYNQQGLSNVAAAGSSEQDGLRLCNGTPSSDGGQASPLTDERRSSTSYKWEQTGQPARKSGINEQAPSRWRPETNLSCDLSALSEDISNSRKCPHCGSCLKAVTPQTVPGTTLDCFGGAGTTGLVADRLGRNAILIELNPQYAEMAERRMKDDAGMFAMVAAE